MARMQDRVAIVTGSARGTGAAIARLFVAEGARVLVSDLRHDDGRALAEELGEAALYRPLDVSDERAWAAAVADTLDAFGSVDVLVNNAAILQIKALEETSPADLEALFRVNQLGPFLGIRAVAAVMRSNGGGSIVNVASSDGVKGMNGVVGYASTKWALRGITKASAMELARDGIRVNAVCPEAGSHEMSAPFLPAGVDSRRAAEHNLGQLLRPPDGYSLDEHVMDVARAVLFFASQDCPTATAADLIVDGGLTAGYIQPGIPGGRGGASRPR